MNRALPALCIALAVMAGAFLIRTEARGWKACLDIHSPAVCRNLMK